MTKQELTYSDQIINTFCVIDDIIKQKQAQETKRIGSGRGRSASLSESEIITMRVMGLKMGFKDLLHEYKFFKEFCGDLFPGIPSYKSYVSLVNSYALCVGEILIAMTKFFLSTVRESDIKYVDATSIAVCNNKRIFDHKVCSGIAKRGMSSMGWFYGFKLHMCVDKSGRPLSFMFTTGNIHDTVVLPKLLQHITGTVKGDAGYIVGEDMEKLLEEMGIHLITGYRKNMKKLVTTSYKAGMSVRQIIEVGFGTMKQTGTLVSSLARSVSGHFSRMFYTVLFYALRFLQNTSYQLLCLS